MKRDKYYYRRWRTGTNLTVWEIRRRATLITNTVIEGSCWIWQGRLSNSGYPRMGNNFAVHRFACELRHGPIPAGHVAMHSCDRRSCVNPMHLSIGTYTDNEQDKLAKGRGRWQK